MGKKANELTDDIFKNSKYIKTIEREYEIKDFRKEYREQYDMILDIFKTFIELNNCFFSDNDMRNDDRVKKAYKLLKNYFKINENENVIGIKYSVRDIQSIWDKHCRSIYNNMSNWFYSISYMIKDKCLDSKILDTIKKEITNEMDILEYSCLFDITRDNITFKKNSIKNYRKYKKYLCKFDNIYSNSNENKNKYRDSFYDKYGVLLDDKDMNKLALLFKLLASLNNGLVNIINDYKIDVDMTMFDNIEERYAYYLQSLNIDYNKDDENFKNDLHNFIDTIGIIKNKIDRYTNYNNTIVIERFDILFFYLTMEQCFYSHKIKIKTDFITKLLNDLIELYKKLKEMREIEKDVSLENLKERYFIPLYKKTNELIERYSDVYEKVS